MTETLRETELPTEEQIGTATDADLPGVVVADIAEGLTVESMSPKKMAFKRYMHHKGAVVATIVMIIMVLFVVFAPITARYGVNQAVFQATPGNPSRRGDSPAPTPRHSAPVATSAERPPGCGVRLLASQARIGRQLFG